MGLDDTYMQIRSSILSRKTISDVRSAYVIISSEESYMVAFGSIYETSHRSQTSAFTANKNCRGSNLDCESCGINGHTIDRCFKIIGYLAGFGKKKGGQNFKGKSVSNNAVRFGCSSGFSNEQSSTVISLNKENSINGKGVPANMAGVISGTNKHITFTDKFLVNVIDISHLIIKVSHPNGTKAFITKIENMPLIDYLTLFDVLVVPEYCVSLMYVHKVARD
ncbi:hypothetical protein Tco_1269752, partial [Tanacetum coccineum]